jgi:hypothetical protein
LHLRNWHCFLTEKVFFTRRQKQALVADNPFRDAGILRNVFAFLPGNWLFLGAVCREWEAVYAGMAAQRLCSFRLNESNTFVICDSKTTFCSATVATPATIRLAVSCGLVISTNEQLQLIAGLHADIEILIVLRELGMLLHDTLFYAIALSGRFVVLQQVFAELPHSRPDKISYYAARSGSISMLKWLREQRRCTFDKRTCEGAASGGQLAAFKSS